MLQNSALIRGAIGALSALFGGFGMFFLYLSIDDPGQVPRALVFLGSAISIALASQHYSGPRNRR
jgi:hypothetical protein